MGYRLRTGSPRAGSRPRTRSRTRGACYYDPETGQYPRRPEPEPRLHAGGRAGQGRRHKPRRPIPEGGISIEDRAAQRGNPRSRSRPRAYSMTPRPGSIRGGQTHTGFRRRQPAADPLLPGRDARRHAGRPEADRSIHEGDDVLSFSRLGRTVCARPVTAVLRNKAERLIALHD